MQINTTPHITIFALPIYIYTYSLRRDLRFAKAPLGSFLSLLLCRNLGKGVKITLLNIGHTFKHAQNSTHRADIMTPFMCFKLNGAIQAFQQTDNTLQECNTHTLQVDLLPRDI